MRFGVVLFTSDRGITPAAAAAAAENAGLESLFVPEHTHIPVKRESAHPSPATRRLPDDRYMRTLDPWVALAGAAAVTPQDPRSAPRWHCRPNTTRSRWPRRSRSLDHLSGGRVVLGAGLRLERRRTDRPQRAGQEATYGACASTSRRCGRSGARTRAAMPASTSSFGPSWAWPKPVQSHVPGADRRRRHGQDLRVDRAQRRRLDHHAHGRRDRRQGRRCSSGCGPTPGGRSSPRSWHSPAGRTPKCWRTGSPSGSPRSVRAAGPGGPDVAGYIAHLGAKLGRGDTPAG